MNINKDTITTLLQLGFSYEDLYNRRLLVPAAGDQSAADDQPAGDQTTPAGDQTAPAGDQTAPAGDQTAPAGDQSVQNAEKSADGDADPAAAAGQTAQIKAMLDAFRDEVKTMIQQNNIASSTRSKDNKTPSVEDAIMNITKGV